MSVALELELEGSALSARRLPASIASVVLARAVSAACLSVDEVDMDESVGVVGVVELKDSVVKYISMKSSKMNAAPKKGRVNLGGTHISYIHLRIYERRLFETPCEAWWISR